MDRLQERLETAAKAVVALEEAVSRGLEASLVERESALLRLACAVETVWKASQLFLEEKEGLVEGSPKGCARASVEAGLLDPGRGVEALQAIDDRNLIVHAYNEELARDIHHRIPSHAKVLEAWLEAMRTRSRR